MNLDDKEHALTVSHAPPQNSARALLCSKYSDVHESNSAYGREELGRADCAPSSASARDKTLDKSVFFPRHQDFHV